MEVPEEFARAVERIAHDESFLNAKGEPAGGCFKRIAYEAGVDIKTIYRVRRKRHAHRYVMECIALAYPLLAGMVPKNGRGKLPDQTTGTEAIAEGN